MHEDHWSLNDSGDFRIERPDEIFDQILHRKDIRDSVMQITERYLPTFQTADDKIL